MKEKTKPVKQIMVNVSDEQKTKINGLKEEMELSDKEFMSVVLEVFDAAKDEDIKTIVEKLVINKQKAKIESRLATIQRKLEKVKDELSEVATETTEEVVEEIKEEGEVVYDASLEEELVG